MQLQHVERDPADNRVQLVIRRIDEQPDRPDAGRQQPGQMGGRVGTERARRPGIENETDRARAAIDRRPHRILRPQPADLDVNRHGPGRPSRRGYAAPPLPGRRRR